MRKKKFNFGGGQFGVQFGLRFGVDFGVPFGVDFGVPFGVQITAVFCLRKTLDFTKKTLHFIKENFSAKSVKCSTFHPNFYQKTRFKADNVP